VKTTNFSYQGNQSIERPPPPFPPSPAVEPKQLKLIPNSVPADVQFLLQKYPSIFRTGDVKPTPTHGVEHHIHTGSHPPAFAKSCRLDPEKLEIAKAELKRLESTSIIRHSKHHGLLLCTRWPKTMDHGGLVVTTAV
jgi:hypothetical protein